MSLHATIRLEGKGAIGVESPVFAYAYDVYERICTEVGHPPPFSFAIAFDDLCEDVDEELEEEGAVPAADEWEERAQVLLNQRGPFFDPALALPVLEAYANYFREHGAEKYRAALHYFIGKDLAADLDDFCEAISTAAATGVRFRIEVG